MTAISELRKLTGETGGHQPFPARSFVAARDALLSAVEEGAPMVVLLGVPGTGKTELLSRVAGELGDEASLVRRGAQLDDHDNLEANVLLIDEATDLTAAGCEHLAERRDRCGKTTILALVDPEAPAVGELLRGAPAVTLEPFSPDDVRAFARTLRPEEGLTDAAVTEIVRRSRGLPRLVRALVGAGAIEAQMAETSAIDAPHIVEAADQLMLPEPEDAPAPDENSPAVTSQEQSASEEDALPEEGQAAEEPVADGTGAPEEALAELADADVLAPTTSVAELPPEHDAGTDAENVPGSSWGRRGIWWPGALGAVLVCAGAAYAAVGPPPKMLRASFSVITERIGEIIGTAPEATDESALTEDLSLPAKAIPQEDAGSGDVPEELDLRAGAGPVLSRQADGPQRPSNSAAISDPETTRGTTDTRRAAAEERAASPRRAAGPDAPTVHVGKAPEPELRRASTIAPVPRAADTRPAPRPGTPNGEASEDNPERDAVAATREARDRLRAVKR